MDEVSDMVVVVVRFERRPMEIEDPVETSQPKRVPPLPPRAEFPHVKIAAIEAVGLYDMPPTGMPAGVTLSIQIDSVQVERPNDQGSQSWVSPKAQFMLEWDGTSNVP